MRFRERQAVLCFHHILVDAGAVHDDLGEQRPVRISLRVHADNAFGDHCHVVVCILKPGVILLRLPRSAPASPASALHVLRDDPRDVVPVVRQGDPHDLRLVDRVLVGQAHDPLRDRRAELRQRHPAHPAQPQPVERLAGAFNQLQTLDFDVDHRLRVPRQLLVRPAAELSVRLPARVRLRVLYDAVQARVPLHVGRAGKVEIVLPDRIEAGIHPASVNRSRDRPQVPSAPQLTLHAGGAPRNVQPERVPAHVVRPPRVVERVRHRLQAVEKAVAVKLVGIGHAVVELAQHPVALLAEDVFHRLAGRAGRSSGDRRRRDLAEQDPVLQRRDRVLQLHRGRVGRVGRPDGPHPPHRARARFLIVQEPRFGCDPFHVGGRHARSALAFLQRQAQRLHRHLPGGCQAVSVQQDHPIHLP